ncbi:MULTISPECIES: alpha/beta fold hydrolase [Pseudonocardia]|uniref:AB hydrolase superfamily protein YdjP n=2 Tax=Pseudonocardia TaxID=1847 RepID=A0A1Y2N6N2_PSEAH|nr:MULTISPECIES: alpha/beta hydrolase [Pseudonocardia]OSY42831.1 AB hydrolase superfamily protein YdjP [Pseudonocardia autotrophica]TDN77408.1 pimeloyl-[acyl-carrier protein] methyl ester esterase [Pseudonocardia autotrophica]BBG01432.1 O-methylpimelyl-ACP methylesterase [Pseudonocardia autotrophica]GEC24489.1 O-methylpimelyl-ACP methylesterase [Pseudonocardia saturnea]
MAFLEVEDGKRVFYEHHAGSGRQVVLVHGWGANARCWDTTLSALLVAGHGVTTIEHRACGRSDADFADTSIGAIAGDVVALVEHLGLREPVLNGWSLGGAVVVEAARRLGANLGGLVLTGGATPRYTAAEGWPYGGTPADVDGVLAGLAADRPGTFRAIAEAVCVKPVGEPVVQSIWLAFLETGPRCDDTLRDLAQIDQREILPTLSVPVLLLAGREDGFVSFDAVAASRTLFPDARLVEFGGVGHAPFLEDGETYRTELLDFLARSGN